jgi:Tol biopolymer transport system component
MFKRSLFVFFLLVVSISSFAQIPDGPYLGQTPPGSAPEVFAPGLVSITDRRDTKAVFSPDGQECFIGTVVSNTFTLLYTKVDSGHWTDIAEASFLNKTGKREPFITPDGEKLFFTGDVADIYVSTKSGDQWSAASKMGNPISTSSEEWHPTVTSDGTLYFCSTRDGDYFVYRSRLNEGQYTEVERLDSTVNTSGYSAWDPYIAADESYLIFTSQRPGGYGRADQYRRHRIRFIC